jgi:Zn-dependent protease with chaperone function
MFEAIETSAMSTGMAAVLAQAAVAAIWQSAAIAFALMLGLRLMPRIPASYRFAAWAAGFLAAVALPFAPALAHLSSPGAAAGSGFTAAHAQPWFAVDSRWALAVAALWLAASAARAAQLAHHTLRLRGLWRSAKPVEVGAAAGLVLNDESVLPYTIDPAPKIGITLPHPSDKNKNVARVGHPESRFSVGNVCNRILLEGGQRARRRIEICTTAALDRPSAIGFFRPRILLPEWIFSRLTAEELEQVILHEAGHLRRRDDWTNLLQKLALVLFPLNPALVWMERQLAREREMACDEAVVRHTRAPRAYAACLANLAEHSLERREIELRAEALALAAWRRRPELVARVHSILWSKKTVTPVAARALLAAVGCLLVVAASALARCPQMVAFVAAPPPQDATLALAPPQNLAPGFRVVETKALLPAPLRAKQRTFAAASRIDSGAAQPANTAEHTAPAQWMVLTAWEQTQSQPARPRAAETGEADEVIPQPGAELPAGIVVTRVVVMVESNAASTNAMEEQSQLLRLRSPRRPSLRMTGEFFQESPAANSSEKAAAAQPAAGAQPNTVNSHSLPPAARKPFDGWLIFEL